MSAAEWNCNLTSRWANIKILNGYPWFHVTVCKARVIPVYNGLSDLLSVVLEETGGLGVDIVIDSRGKHGLWRKKCKVDIKSSNVSSGFFKLTSRKCHWPFVSSVSAGGGVRWHEASSTQTWHHQCAGSWGSLGHIPKRPSGQLVSYTLKFSWTVVSVCI